MRTEFPGSYKIRASEIGNKGSHKVQGGFLYKEEDSNWKYSGVGGKTEKGSAPKTQRKRTPKKQSAREE